MDGPLRNSARTTGMRIRIRKTKEFFLIFSFVSSWMRKRSKRKMLIGSIAVFSFEPKARIPAMKQRK